MREKKHMKTAYRLKECLEEHNMKATELADKIGVNRSAITHYTSGMSCPKNDTAQKIADVFNVNPLWLMELSDEKYLNNDFQIMLSEKEVLMVEAMRKTDETTRKMVERILAYIKNDDEQE